MSGHISVERLREMLNYDPQTGIFTWKIRPSPAAAAGDKAGCFDRGYIRIKVKGKLYNAHRLAWFYCYGINPINIDHINRDSTDNRIDNLREASQSQNRANSRNRKTKTKSGLKGVYYQKHTSLWFASMGSAGVYKYLGSWKDKKDAAIAYDEALVREFGEFACTNKSLGLI